MGEQHARRLHAPLLERRSGRNYWGQVSAVAILLICIGVGIVLVALVSLPLRVLNISESRDVTSMAGVEALGLDLAADVTIRVEATTGGIHFALDIEGDIGAKIESTTSLGGVNVARRIGFSGTKALLHMGNYPAESNFGFGFETTTGGIDIDARRIP